MHLAPFFPLAASDGIGLDLIVWLVAGAFWVVSQIATAKRRRERKKQGETQTGDDAPSSSGPWKPPAPEELAEIFKRLGADVPNTPPPPRPAVQAQSVSPPVPQPRPGPPSQMSSAARWTPPPPPKPPSAPRKTKVVAKIQPDIARRLARVKREAEEAARQAAAEQAALDSLVPGVQSREGDTRAIDTSTLHTGTILPRLYAMSMRMTNLPSVPMPGFSQIHHQGDPLRARLRTRRELREALVAQTLLQPPKSQQRF